MKTLTLPKYVCGHFCPIDKATSKGIIQSVYLTRLPSVKLSISDMPTQITGYLSYNLVTCASGGYTCGVIFSGFRKYTTVHPNRMCVCASRDGEFSLVFNLEKLGILILKSRSGSALVLKSEISGKILVDINGSQT